ncbi:MAG: RpoL/Rpb11 RNA polymerase subunit family protein [Nanoarchaeota archaeon]
MEHIELEILKSSKDEIEVRLGNMTLVEILRVYLNKDPAVSFAAWKREHPSEKPILRVTTEGKTAKKAINDAIASITKELDKIEADFKKLK